MGEIVRRFRIGKSLQCHSLHCRESKKETHHVSFPLSCLFLFMVPSSPAYKYVHTCPRGYPLPTLSLPRGLSELTCRLPGGGSSRCFRRAMLFLLSVIAAYRERGGRGRGAVMLRLKKRPAETSAAVLLPDREWRAACCGWMPAC